MGKKEIGIEEFFSATRLGQQIEWQLSKTWVETSQNFGFLEAATGLKNIVKIIFRHRKRKYAPVGAKSLITRDSINAARTVHEFRTSYTRVKIHSIHMYIFSGLRGKSMSSRYTRNFT